MKYNSSNNTPETKSYVFSKAYKKKKKYVCQGTLSCNTNPKLNKKIQKKNIFFNPKKRTKKFTYQVNLIYLPSKLIYLPSKFTFTREI